MVLTLRERRTRRHAEFLPDFLRESPRSLRLRVDGEPLELPARMREHHAKMREADALRKSPSVFYRHNPHGMVGANN